MLKERRLSIIAIEEGRHVSDKIIEQFNLSSFDIGRGQNSENISAFTGIVIKSNDLLVSFPKHYVDLKVFNNLKYQAKVNHIRLIMKSIIHYETSPDYTEFRKSKDMTSSFPFDVFFNIYDYYQKYGLYHEKLTAFKRGLSGKISFKNTIARANKIISNNNLIFLPFYVSKSLPIDNLITQCMIFAMNYTQQLFGPFLPLPSDSKLLEKGIDKNIENNYPNIIGALNELRSSIFKDIDTNLLNNLILYFEGLNATLRDVQSIKHYHYNNVWEKAVEKYLNSNFSGIVDDKLTFNGNNNHIQFEKGKFGNYDMEHPTNNLQPDHYYLDKLQSIQYIFDSKYYVQLKGLNHKQLVYHMLLTNRARKTYDALIMPSRSKTRTEVHVNINQSFLPSEMNELKILLTHLNTKDVIENFVN